MSVIYSNIWSKSITFGYNIFESKKESNASPIIFLHGMLASKEMWDNIPQIIADKTKRKVYVYDARNHGESDHSDVFSFDLTVKDLFDFMDQMQIPKTVLVGHSMGGMTSILAALKEPERVEMIFPIDIFVLEIGKDMIDQLTHFTTSFVNTVRSLPKELPESEIVKTVVKSLFKDIPEDSEMQNEKESMMKSKFLFKRKPDGSYDASFNADAILKFAKEAQNKKIIPDGQFEGPAYFIYGTKSHLKVNLQEENIKRQFPEAKLIPVEGASHNVFIDFPDIFIQILLDYL